MKEPTGQEKQSMTHKRAQKPSYVDPDGAKRIYQKQLRGAFVWSGCVTLLWILMLVSYLSGSADIDSFKHVSVLGVLGHLMYVPLLWAAKHTTGRLSHELIAYLISALQAIITTLYIYFMGGLRLANLITVYAALIAYVGMVAPGKFPFFLTIFCVIPFSLMVTLEHLGVIPHQNKMLPYYYEGKDVFVIVFMATVTLFMVMFVSTYTADLLKRARNKARKAERMKSVFLANMSHEIRTPMNAVIGFTDMLLDTKLDEEQGDYARTAKSSGEALLSLINDILDFSKIEAGELDFEEIDFDPELLAYDVCDIIRPRIVERPIEILCRIGDNLPSRVKGDPLRVRQVLTNLMGNAVKFTESGEIELSLDVEEKKDGRMKFHAMIRDTGIGIPEDRLSSVFVPFEQGDGSTTRKYGGTGLGLAICKQISNRMDGEVWAESEVAKGSIFHFTGWIGKGEDKEAKRFAPVSLSGRKALIVDDNQTNLNVLTNVLKLIGMSVVALTDPEEVVPALQEAVKAEDPFDICITDIQMPDMSGYDLGEQIRDPKYQIPHIPLIALSSSMERDAKRCKEAGFDGFLGKPIHREKLFHMMERILGEREEGDREEVATEKIMTQYSVREDMKHSVNILVAEDNPVNQKLAKLMLTKAGYKVEVVNDGKEAVEKFTSSPEEFDLIFMDIQMPKMDGMVATRIIREKGFNTIPIAAMTAHAMKGDREKCLDAGMDDYITKPIKRELVFEILEKWVFKRKSS